MNVVTNALSATCQNILVEIKRLAQDYQRPVLLVLGGGSGAGKATLAAILKREIDAVVVPFDFDAGFAPDGSYAMGE